jgi:hypothetical protein
MKIKTAIIGIISGLFFTAFIYNIWIDEFIIKYMAICFFYFYLFYYLSKRNKINWYLFLCCVTTPLIIDASVLITFPEIVPLRFPFSSIFPVLGCLAAYIYLKRSKAMFYCLAVLSLVFFYLSYILFIPGIMSFILNKEQKQLYDSPIVSATFYDTSRKPIELKNILTDNANLVETYFVGCSACEEKSPQIKKTASLFTEKELAIIYICNGSTSDFNDFKEHARSKWDNRITYLYDADSVLDKSGINGYPTEILLNGKKIVSVTEGFNELGGRKYVETEKSKIQKILHENNK